MWCRHLSFENSFENRVNARMSAHTHNHSGFYWTESFFTVHVRKRSTFSYSLSPSTQSHMRAFQKNGPCQNDEENSKLIASIISHIHIISHNHVVSDA